MINVWRRIVSGIIFAAGAQTAALHAADCKVEAKLFHDAIAEEPTKVLVIIDEALSSNAACACDIVKAAIVATEAEPSLVREIVVTALTAAPDEAAVIAECAVAEAPEAAAEIKAALTEAFAGAKSGGGKSVVYDDGYSAKGGKEITYEEDVEEDFGPEPVVISGVYLIAPSASSAGGFGIVRDRNGNIIDRDEIEQQNRLIEILRRRARGRDAGDGGTTVSGPDPTETELVSDRVSSGLTTYSGSSSLTVGGFVGVIDVIGGFDLPEVDPNIRAVVVVDDE